MMQTQPDVKFSVLVTGDHSTPVMFGDHSHEPVPLACADVADVVLTLGENNVLGFDLGPLPALTQHVKVPDGTLEAQAHDKKRLFDSQRLVDESQHQCVAAASSSESEVLMHQRDASCGRVFEADRVVDDVLKGRESVDLRKVVTFDEISAARGMLGRFPSSELMPLIRSILSV
jgi:hypothetical protein